VSRGPILIVDDDASIRQTVAEVLTLEEYAVATAPNGVEALAAVARQRPGLVLLDMRMPILDGWGFARALKERNIALPILVMTAAQDSEHWAEEVGAAGYLAKPFDLAELLEAVESLYGPSES
jgi:two-component system chemotaxis response regulator CheY